MAGRFGMQMLQLTVLARFLDPSDFGLMAIVIALVAIAHIVSDLGMSTAIIHRREIDDSQLASLYWLNVGSGLVLSLLLAAAAPLIAIIYQDPRLLYLVMASAPVFVLSALGQQLRVLAEKRLEFRRLAVVELLAQVGSGAAAIAAVLLGAGVYALVIAMLCNAMITSLLAWCYLAHGWRPRLRLRIREVRPFLTFGGWMIGNGAASAVNTYADLLVGGLLLNPAALGRYHVARDLNLRLAILINPIVTRVALPLMATAQGDRVRLAAMYAQVLRMTSSINFPLYACLAVFAPTVVPLVLGPGWKEAVPIAQVLALWGALRSTGSPVGCLLFAVGRPARSFAWNLALLPVMPAAVVIGAQWGALGLAFALVLVQGLLIIPGWWILVRPCCDLSLRIFAAQLLPAAIAAGLAAAMGGLVQSLFAHALLAFIIAALAMVTVYLGISVVINRPWLKAMRELIAGRAAAASAVAVVDPGATSASGDQSLSPPR